VSKSLAEPVSIAAPRHSAPAPVALAEAPPLESSSAIRGIVFRLAWPSIVENMLQSIYGLLLVMMIGQLGSSAIAGVGAANSLIQVAMACFFAVSMGTTVLVAHAVGALNHEAASRAAKQSLVFGLILGLIISALGVLFAPQAIAMLGAQPEVVAQGSSFLRAFSLGGISMVVTFIAGSIMRGSGDARTPMLVTLISLAISLAIGYPLIFGKFGLPALGAVGAGVAGALVRSVGCLVLVGLLFRAGRPVSLRGWHDWRPALAPFRRLVNIGLPSMFESLFRAGGMLHHRGVPRERCAALFRAGGMLLFSVIVFRLGTATAAAQQIVQQIALFSMMPGFGFSMAAMTLVGQSLGAENPVRAERATWFSTRSCIFWMGAMGLAFFFGGPQIMALFTADADIIAQGAAALKIVALAQPGQAFGMVLAGALRGAGDTRYPMMSTGGVMWLVRLPVAWFCGIFLGFGLVGVYSGWLVDSLVLSGLNWLRYRTGAWKQRRVAVA